MRNAIEMLKEVVAESGDDFVYLVPEGISCRYEYNGEPSCGVGKVMAKMRVKPTTLAKWDNSSELAFIDIYERGLAPKSITPAQARALQMFQANQDQGMPYREALEIALECLSEEEGE